MYVQRGGDTSCGSIPSSTVSGTFPAWDGGVPAAVSASGSAAFSTADFAPVTPFSVGGYYTPMMGGGRRSRPVVTACATKPKAKKASSPNRAQPKVSRPKASPGKKKVPPVKKKVPPVKKKALIKKVAAARTASTVSA